MMQLETAMHPAETHFLAALDAADPRLGQVAADARTSGIPWPTIWDLVVRYGPQAWAILQQIVQALRTPAPLLLACLLLLAPKVRASEIPAWSAWQPVAAEAKPALIHVECPAATTITLDGARTSSTGAYRVFETPPLHHEGRYEVKATLCESDGCHCETRSITVAPGTTTTVKLLQTFASARSQCPCALGGCGCSNGQCGSEQCPSRGFAPMAGGCSSGSCAGGFAPMMQGGSCGAGGCSGGNCGSGSRGFFRR